jgi:hypothetical protein
MAISRQQLAKELEPGLNALFGLEYKNYENQHKEIFDTENSDRAFEEEVMLSGFDKAGVKSEGAAVAYDNAQETYTARYQHETIALAFSLTEENVEDNLYDKISTRYTKALARSMAQTKQTKAANVLNNAFQSSGYNGGDGESLIGNAHPTIAGNLSNRPTTLADLSETSLEQAMIDIGNLKDERGLKIAARGMKLIIPADNQFTAERITKSAQRVGTADNDINALKSMGMIPQGYVVNNYLSDGDAWFIKTDIPNGMKHMVRAAIKTAMEGDFETGNMRYKARERYSFGWSDWRGVYGSDGSA